MPVLHPNTAPDPSFAASRKARRRAWALVPLALLSTSCVLGPRPVFARHVAEGAYCASPHALDARARGQAPDDPSLPAPFAVQRGFSPRALDTARAIGALGVVERLAAAEARHATESEIVDLRGQVNDAIALATLDLSSTVAHLQCEEGRAGQIASDLRDAEEQQTRRLTAYSLLVGAAAAVASGILVISIKDQVPGAVVAMAGGAVGGVFGLVTLSVQRTTRFIHARNILGQVWFGESHPDFPDLVWEYLTRSQFRRGSHDSSMRQELIDAWKESGRLGTDAQHPEPERVALYFGEGGVYDADGLEDRGDMLSEVRELVDLMNHDLQHLANESASH